MRRILISITLAAFSVLSVAPAHAQTYEQDRIRALQQEQQQQNSLRSAYNNCVRAQTDFDQAANQFDNYQSRENEIRMLQKRNALNSAKNQFAKFGQGGDCGGGSEYYAGNNWGGNNGWNGGNSHNRGLSGKELLGVGVAAAAGSIIGNKIADGSVGRALGDLFNGGGNGGKRYVDESETTDVLPSNKLPNPPECQWTQRQITRNHFGKSYTGYFCMKGNQAFWFAETTKSDWMDLTRQARRGW